MASAQLAPATPSSHSASGVPAHSRRIPPASTSSTSLAFPQSVTMHNLAGHGARVRSSRTWTASSDDLGLMNDTDELDDRAAFVQEYNRLAKKHGVRLLVADDFTSQKPRKAPSKSDKRGWLFRILRSSSSKQSRPLKPGTKQPSVRHRRSVSDIAHNFAYSCREPPKSMDLQTMVRLSGKGVLSLPQEHAPGSLVLPTCIRAMAQHLAQHATIRGLFRIPGSVKVINALIDDYCYTENDGADVASTVRCANLPVYIQSSVHDVASAFKRLLSTLPGGILGSLSIFDAFVAISFHLCREPEFPRTKQTKVRARLIALAIGTIKSKFRRELICAVFGLLSLIGRAAEVAPREDEDGRPLPTSDLMGYSALGIVFGPLLLGDLLDQYTMNLATPSSGLLLFPLSPRKLQKCLTPSPAEKIPAAPPAVDKIHIANGITEMLISNWVGVVQQMKSLGMHHRKNVSSFPAPNGSLRPSTSESSLESFVVEEPKEWGQGNRDGSPELETPTVTSRTQRPRSKKSTASRRSCGKPSGTVLSTASEEKYLDGATFRNGNNLKDRIEQQGVDPNIEESVISKPFHPTAPNPPGAANDGIKSFDAFETSHRAKQMGLNPREHKMCGSQGVSMGDVPPRTSSKPRPWIDSPTVNMPSKILDGAGHAGISPTRGSQSIHLVDDNGGTGLGDFRGQIPVSPASSAELEQTNRSEGPRNRNHIVASQGSQSSDHLVDMAVEAEPRSPYHLLGSQEFERRTHLAKETAASIQSENEATCRTCTLSRSSPQGQASQTQCCHLFYHTPTGDVEPHRTSRTLDPVPRSSIDVTPGHPSTPMGVPPGLVVQNPMLGSICGETLRFPNEIWRDMNHDLSESTEAAVENEEVSDLSRKSIRKPETEAGSYSTGVRAMAEMFEGQDESSEPCSLKVMNRSQGQVPMVWDTQSWPTKSAKSRPLWESHEDAGFSTKSQNIVLTRKRPKSSQDQDLELPTLGISASDSVALRAAAIMVTEKQHQGPSTKRCPLAGLRQEVIPPKKAEPEVMGSLGNWEQGPPILGTMVPYQEHPPIAQHLSLLRPHSSASSSQRQSDNVEAKGRSSPVSRPTSTMGLHTRIRNLQRQLDVKAEDVAQLRRQLEAQEGSDVGTLSEQLRKAKRDAQMWKERAEAAERRLRVLEKFTSRLKGTRETVTAASQQESPPREARG